MLSKETNYKKSHKFFRKLKSKSPGQKPWQIKRKLSRL